MVEYIYYVLGEVEILGTYYISGWFEYPAWHCKKKTSKNEKKIRNKKYLIKVIKGIKKHTKTE